MIELISRLHAQQQYLVELKTDLLDQKISPAEFTGLCLMPFLAQKSQSFQKSTLLKSVNSTSYVMEFLNNYNWKGYSDRIRRSLYQWHVQEYPLILWHHIPTPFELLKVQAQGQRVITVFDQAKDWEKTHLGKTPWEFIVHDLIHADHFFENSEWRAGQTQFYQFILGRWDSEMIVSLRNHCSEQFDYLISDMNSHPQHLHQTLAALCLLAWKKRVGIDLKQKLPALEESQYQNELRLFLE